MSARPQARSLDWPKMYGALFISGALIRDNAAPTGSEASPESPTP